MKYLPTILAALMMPIAAQAANIRPIKPGHVFILAGGVDRIVAKDARVAVHSAGTPKGEDIATQGITLLMARHISRMGAPDTVVAKIVTTENSSVYQLTAADMTGWVR